MNKEQILTELRNLRSALPSDHLNVEEQIIKLSNEARDLANKVIKSGGSTTELKLEISNLEEQIRAKEREVEELRAKSVEESATDYEEMVDKLKASTQRKIELMKLYGTDAEPEELRRELDRLDAEEKSIISTFEAVSPEIREKYESIQVALDEYSDNYQAGTAGIMPLADVRDSEESLYSSIRSVNVEGLQNYARGQAELSALQSSLDEAKSNLSSHNDYAELYELANKRADSLQVLRDAGWTDTQTHLDNLISSYESGSMDEAAVLAELTSLREHQGALYDFTPRERELELAQIASQKQELEAKIASLDSSIAEKTPDASYDERIRQVDREMLQIRADEMGVDYQTFIRSQDVTAILGTEINYDEVRTEITSDKAKLESLNRSRTVALNRLKETDSLEMTEILKYEREALRKQLRLSKTEIKEIEQRLKWNKLLAKKEMLKRAKTNDEKLKFGKNWERTLEELDRDRAKSDLSALKSREEYLKNSYQSEEVLDNLIVAMGGEKKIVEDSKKDEKADEKTQVAPAATATAATAKADDSKKDDDKKDVVPPFPKEGDEVKSDTKGTIAEFDEPTKEEKTGFIGFFNKHKKAIITAVAFLLTGLTGIAGGLLICSLLDHFQGNKDQAIADALNNQPAISAPVTPGATVTPELQNTPKPQITPKPQVTPGPTERPETEPEIPSGDYNEGEDIGPSNPNPSTPTTPDSTPTPKPEETPTPKPEETPTPKPEENNSSHTTTEVDVPTLDGGTTEQQTSIEVNGVVFVKNADGNYDAYLKNDPKKEIIGTIASNKDGSLDNNAAIEFSKGNTYTPSGTSTPSSSTSQGSGDQDQDLGDQGQGLGDQGQGLGDQGQGLGNQGQDLGAQGQGNLQGVENAPEGVYEQIIGDAANLFENPANLDTSAAAIAAAETISEVVDAAGKGMEQ